MYRPLLRGRRRIPQMKTQRGAPELSFDGTGMDGKFGPARTPSSDLPADETVRLADIFGEPEWQST